jgi:hypothetical protein
MEAARVMETRLHGVTFQKKVLFRFIIVRTSISGASANYATIGKRMNPY